MKKRTGKRQRSFASRKRKPLSSIGTQGQRKRRSWTFEHLEDRLVFSTSPISVVSYSNDTPEGALLTKLNEEYWAALAASNGTSAATSTSSTVASFKSLPTDPYFPDPNNPDVPLTQWHLLNIGQQVGNGEQQSLFGIPGEDLNVVPAWNQVDAQGRPIIGTGIKVAVIDSGVQIFHPDLAAHISPTLRFNAETGSSNVNPSPLDPGSFHGTAVAGIIGAIANNGIGGVGVAPGVTIVPIKGGTTGISDAAVEEALRYALEHGVDVTNNSYGPADEHAATALPPALLQLYRTAVLSGRDGKGMINVYASGNDAPGGGYSSYNKFGTRYVIQVTGVDENGLYYNTDGTFTNYPVAGPSVLVAAPTGSGPFDIGDDDGFGSGITTTDLVGDAGLNGTGNPDGSDPDGDFLQDIDFTSRMNGTSAAAPMVAGVVALMLQANPNLTYRDVEEILIRSARQNAQFETPHTGILAVQSQNTWITNQVGPFREADRFDLADPQFNPFIAQLDPTADPDARTTTFFGIDTAPDTNDGNRQFLSTYEPMPFQFTTGSGYTVSSGYGVQGEAIGYAHGVVDAGLAVYMAKNWNEYKTPELTFTTSAVVGGPIQPAIKVKTNPGTNMVVPGGIGVGGFKPYWDEYFSTTPFASYTGPGQASRGESYMDFAVPPSQEMNVEWVEVNVSVSGSPAGLDQLRLMLTSPDGTQSELINYYVDPSFIPASQQIGAGQIFGDPAGDISASGTFNWTFRTNRSWGENSSSEVITHAVTGEPVLQDGLPIFRNWELHVENYAPQAFTLGSVEVIWHGTKIQGGSYDKNYAENGILNAQRVQGFIGIDSNGDNDFNYGRYIQTVSTTTGNPPSTTSDIRAGDVQRVLDFKDNNNNFIFDEGDEITQEKFADSITVNAYRVWDGVREATPVATFLTGADGNYYFDLDVQGDLALRTQVLTVPDPGGGTMQIPGPHNGDTLEYEISIDDPKNRQILDDLDTFAETTSDPSLKYQKHYQTSWRINPNWFYAPDRDFSDITNPGLLGDNPGEIFYDTDGTHLGNYLFDPSDLTDLPELDLTTGQLIPGLATPVPFTDNGQIVHLVPSPVKNLNFLLKDEAPSNSFNVTGTVFSDVNGDGKVTNGQDAGAGGFKVFWDKDGNGNDNNGTEAGVFTNPDGSYILPIDLAQLGEPVPQVSQVIRVGVVPPNDSWTPTDPGHDAIETAFAGPGSPDQHLDFFFQPPAAAPPNGAGQGTIQGVVFNDLNGNGTQDSGDNGVPGFVVFLDEGVNGHNGILDAGEVSVTTGANGGFFFNNVDPGVYWVDVVVPADWALETNHVIDGHRVVQVFAGGSQTGVTFPLDNLAKRDWGDLPNSYGTTAAANGPSNIVQVAFRLGSNVDGEADGIPTANATGDNQVGGPDDGVQIISNGGVLQHGDNTLRVTVFGSGGLLTGWMDFNNNGVFDASEKLTFIGWGQEADLNQGTTDLHITIPNDAVIGIVASRFRWGQAGLGPLGSAGFGEVEDYLFNLNFVSGDFNRDGTVDAADYVTWRKVENTPAAPPFSGADGNGDGIINPQDYVVWREGFGQTVPALSAALTESASESAASSTLSSNSEVVSDNNIAAGGQLNEFTSRSTAIPSTRSTGSTVIVTASGSSNTATSSSTSESSNVSLPSGLQSSSSVTSTSISSNSVAAAPLLAAFSFDAGQPTSMGSVSTSVADSSSGSASALNDGLLLLDEAWTDHDTTLSDHDDESLYHDDLHESDNANDLALAAVLNDDHDLWDAI